MAFADFIIRESLRKQAPSVAARLFTAKKTDLQLVGQAELLHSPDEPFGGIVLIPFDSISVVHRELVMEVVITLSDGDEGGDHMIARCVLVIERSFTKPVSEGIDTEGGLSTNQSAR